MSFFVVCINLTCRQGVETSAMGLLWTAFCLKKGAVARASVYQLDGTPELCIEISGRLTAEQLPAPITSQQAEQVSSASCPSSSGQERSEGDQQRLSSVFNLAFEADKQDELLNALGDGGGAAASWPPCTVARHVHFVDEHCDKSLPKESPEHQRCSAQGCSSSSQESSSSSCALRPLAVGCPQVGGHPALAPCGFGAALEGSGAKGRSKRCIARALSSATDYVGAGSY